MRIAAKFATRKYIFALGCLVEAKIAAEKNAERWANSDLKYPTLLDERDSLQVQSAESVVDSSFRKLYCMIGQSKKGQKLLNALQLIQQNI